MESWDLLNSDIRYNYRLNVMITSRDRSIMTLKTIDSLLENSTLFESINIYIFDNLSETTPERFSIFSKLLNEGKIVYYSYDTSISLTNSFAKGIVFNRWINMMEIDGHIRKNMTKRPDLVDYYLVIDNDMLVGKEWDEYFISVGEQILSIAPTIKYLVKYKGGIPKVSRDRSGKNYYIKSIFHLEKTIEVLTADFGGGSGFWFMNYEQLLFLKWGSKEFFKIYKSFKKHDTTTWSMLGIKNQKQNYVAGVKPNKPDENPLVLHLGGVVGSMCNSLVFTGRDYKRDKPQFEIKEKELENMSVNEIFEKYKNTDCQIW